jgi:hypothetical protein
MLLLLSMSLLLVVLVALLGLLFGTAVRLVISATTHRYGSWMCDCNDKHVGAPFVVLLQQQNNN